MTVTDVRIRKINKEGRMKAIVSITLDNNFVVHDVRVIEGNNGLFVAMPSKKLPDGGYKDVAHPINAETRQLIQDAVLAAYADGLQALEQDGQEEDDSAAKAELEENLQENLEEKEGAF
ncbi:MAG: septation regulator SpoVG [Firmicutes bacterium]|nr:septation regulator SpoVG [Bacillota bacterium]